MKFHRSSTCRCRCRWKQYSCFLLFFDRTFNVTRIRNKNQKDRVCIWHILIKSWKNNNKLIMQRENQGHERILKHLSLLYSCTNLLFLISKKRKSWKSETEDGHLFWKYGKDYEVTFDVLVSPNKHTNKIQ